LYEGFLSIDGIEIINGARAAVYIAALMPGVDVLCTADALPDALGQSAYTTPDGDAAPWYTGWRAAAARFYGLYPGKVQGAEDSTRKLQVTQLTGDGAVLTSPRYNSKEIRFVTTAFAADEEAMEEGLAWLRDVLGHNGCSNADPGCAGRDVQMFSALPADQVAAFDLARTFHRAEVTEGPLVTRKYSSKAGAVWRVEFTLTAGIPWAFTSLATIGSLNMDTAVNFQDPTGEDCAAGISTYDDFVDDPYYTGISRPPRAPVVLPPNILAITSWRRETLAIPASHSERWGRVTPVLSVSTVAAVQYLRLRFYRTGAVSCAFDAEVIVSYLPAGSTLTLDARTREASLLLSTGRVVPAGHLLFGSGGRPFLWASLGCQLDYTLTADLMPGQSGVVVLLDTAVRL
jgi:hypothetical protein